MSERSIILRDRDVRAVLAGTKTQHRVPIRGDVIDTEDGLMIDADADAAPPPGLPGDTLWVRECYALIWPGEDAPDSDRDCVVEYRADGAADRLPGEWPPEGRGDPCCPRWRSSSSMPRWASRIRLRVTDVRVERDGDTWVWALTWEVVDSR